MRRASTAPGTCGHGWFLDLSHLLSPRRITSRPVTPSYDVFLCPPAGRCVALPELWTMSFLARGHETRIPVAIGLPASEG
ncbi:hypothetical protein VTN77DRAFT_1684 [Rasamsonia byssochlamydoides]|uniref:uncharacterized protein n=1 Tax=Rasamsonia byssochlamydoides TaxID=89139 RepID=UPI00374370A6